MVLRNIISISWIRSLKFLNVLLKIFCHKTHCNLSIKKELLYHSVSRYRQTLSSSLNTTVHTKVWNYCYNPLKSIILPILLLGRYNNFKYIMRTLPHLISQLLQIYNIFLQKSNILLFYSYNGINLLLVFLLNFL